MTITTAIAKATPTTQLLTWTSPFLGTESGPLPVQPRQPFLHPAKNGPVAGACGREAQKPWFAAERDAFSYEGPICPELTSLVPVGGIRDVPMRATVSTTVEVALDTSAEPSLPVRGHPGRPIVRALPS